MIVIPMAGMSLRFFNAGYHLPKYMLLCGGKSIFEWSLSSFQRYFDDEEFLFIVRDQVASNFVASKLDGLQIRCARIVVMDRPSLGQADTVDFGLRSIGYSGDIFVFNIDTVRRDFVKFQSLDKLDGYIEVFKGEGENWSFAETRGRDKKTVLRVAEKNRISEWCSNGLYYFRSSDWFCDAVDRVRSDDVSKLYGGEIYIAPLYNDLIAESGRVEIFPVDLSFLSFIGTPQEYILFCRLVQGS